MSKFLAVVAALILIGSATIGNAQQIPNKPEITISGFISYDYNAIDDLADNPFGGGNPDERHFDLESELDVGIKWAWATARFDLNIPTDSNETPSLGVCCNEIGIEQARFDLTPEFGQEIGMVMTGGAFNAPIGLDYQDPDQMDNITHNLQFDLRPANLLGLDLAINPGPFTIGAILANEWQNDTNEQLTYGFHSGLKMGDAFNLSLGGLFRTEAIGDNYVVNAVASTSVIPSMVFSVESTVDDHNLGLGATAKISCPEPILFGTTLRYDRVLASAGSDFTTRFYFANPVLFIPFGFAIPIEDHDIELLSLTAFVEPMEHLLLRVEGNATKVNVENNSIADKTYYGVLAEAVYRF